MSQSSDTAAGIVEPLSENFSEWFRDWYRQQFSDADLVRKVDRALAAFATASTGFPCLVVPEFVLRRNILDGLYTSGQTLYRVYTPKYFFDMHDLQHDSPIHLRTGVASSMPLGFTPHSIFARLRATPPDRMAKTVVDCYFDIITEVAHTVKADGPDSILHVAAPRLMLHVDGFLVSLFLYSTVVANYSKKV